MEVKQELVKALNDFLDPIRERRAQYEDKPDMVREILMEGTRKARAVARRRSAWCARR